MGMFRNMEVVLVLCFGLVCAAAVLGQAPRMRGAVSAQDVPVVIVIGKRLSAAEKAQVAQEAG